MTKRLSLLAIALFVASMTFAQTTLKFGHINSTQLLSFMPETKAADSTLERFGKSLENQLKTMTAEYQNKLQDYKDKSPSMAEPVKDSKEKELTDLGQRIQDFQESAQSSIEKKKEELYSPIIKKAQDAIHDISKDKGYSYVFDTSVGALLYAQDADDLMAQVKQKLGLK
jgi:outer membrane protein